MEGRGERVGGGREGVVVGGRQVGRCRTFRCSGLIFFLNSFHCFPRGLNSSRSQRAVRTCHEAHLAYLAHLAHLAHLPYLSYLHTCSNHLRSQRDVLTCRWAAWSDQGGRSECEGRGSDRTRQMEGEARSRGVRFLLLKRWIERDQREKEQIQHQCEQCH